MQPVFTETAGGVTVAAAKQLRLEGKLSPDDEIVLCITGCGFKTLDAVQAIEQGIPVIDPDLASLERLVT